jgi:transposase-like protein
MKTILTDEEYAAERNASDAPLCPYCMSTRVTVTIPLHWDENGRTTGLATESFHCDACSHDWTEILRPIAYER